MTPATQNSKAVTILLADDDPDDRLMVTEALKQTICPPRVVTVEDGDDLMDYLYCRGKYAQEQAPTPNLILLDLNMPKKNGHEVLREIKADNRLRHIPIVILTTSREQEDVFSTYNLGVNSFITKPVTFESLVSAMKVLGKYWFEIVQLPPERQAC